MLCSCGGRLQPIAIITDPVVVDRILKHRKDAGIHSPFEPRPPPQPLDRASKSDATDV
jgi:hypothetical protein